MRVTTLRYLIRCIQLIHISGKERKANLPFFFFCVDVGSGSDLGGDCGCWWLFVVTMVTIITGFGY